MQKPNATLTFKLAAIAAAVSMHGAVLAQSSPASDAVPAAQQQSGAVSDAKRSGHAHNFHKHHRHMHHHQRAAMLVPGYGPLGDEAVTALKLNDDQKKLVQEARDLQKAQRSDRFAAMKEQRTERLEALKEGKLDPHAALEQVQQKRKAAAERHDEIAGKWLAVWDSLDDGQQKLVVQQFADKAEKRAERRQKHADRHAKQDKAADTAATKS